MTADHMNCLYAKMFPDSNIAKKFTSAHTKTTCILNEAIMPSLHDYVVTYMKTNPFGLVTDGSSHTAINKMNFVCALIFDVNNSNKVCLKFFDMCPTRGEDCWKSEICLMLLILPLSVMAYFLVMQLQICLRS